MSENLPALLQLNPKKSIRQGFFDNPAQFRSFFLSRRETLCFYHINPVRSIFPVLFQLPLPCVQKDRSSSYRRFPPSNRRGRSEDLDPSQYKSPRPPTPFRRKSGDLVPPSPNKESGDPRAGLSLLRVPPACPLGCNWRPQYLSGW